MPSNSPVIDEIHDLGGKHSVRFLLTFLDEYLPPRERHENDRGSLRPEPELDRVLQDVEGPLGKSGAFPFNLIPASGSPGACCPLLVGFALAGFHSKSSGRRLTFRDLTVQVAAHTLLCYGTHQEMLILTPNWRQDIFDSSLAPLFEAFRKTSHPAFIVETGRTGLILRWPW